MLGVEANDRLFHHFDRGVRQVADAVLPAATQPVEVFAVASTRCPHDDQPVLATSAPEEPLQVVVVGALARTAAVMTVKNALHPFEGVEIRQGFMPTWVLDPVVQDHAYVVLVSQQHAQALLGDGAALRPPLSAWHAESGHRSRR